jgi:hypothetical protein
VTLTKLDTPGLVNVTGIVGSQQGKSLKQLKEENGNMRFGLVTLTKFGAGSFVNVTETSGSWRRR